MTSMPWSRVNRLDGAVVRDPDPGCSVLGSTKLVGTCSNRSFLGLIPIEWMVDGASIWTRLLSGTKRWVAGIRAIKLPSCLLRNRLSD
jgi:hypothetical protein